MGAIRGQRSGLSFQAHDSSGRLGHQFKFLKRDYYSQMARKKILKLDAGFQSYRQNLSFCGGEAEGMKELRRPEEEKALWRL